MPSPFPGMDPYLEGPAWHSFHMTFCVEIASQLNPKLGLKYIAVTEEWLAVEALEEVTISARRMRPDVSVVREERTPYAVAVLEPPIQMDAPLEVTNPIRFIEIHRSD